MAKPALTELLDLKVMQKLFRFFEQATDLGVILLDHDGHRVLGPAPPGEKMHFCQLVHSTAQGEALCRETHRRSGEESFRWGSPYIYNCPFGLMEWAVPVVVQNTLIGVIICGQVLIQNLDDLSYEQVIRRCREFGLRDDEVNSALEQVKILSGEKVTAAAELLFLIANHIARSGHLAMAHRKKILEQQAQLAEAIQMKKSMGLSGRLTYSKEKELIGMLRLGNITGARATLNEILGSILLEDYTTPDITKARILELLVVVSRAAVELGSDMNTILGSYMRYFKKLKSVDAREELYSWVIVVLERLTRSIYKSRNVEKITLISEAINYMEEHYGERITLNDVARSVNRSPYYFSHLIKNETGLTYNDWLIKVRMKKAKEMLHNRELSIARIAAQLNYNDQSYFDKVFKRYEGISPSQYRKKVLE
jgi:two-component system response regulator YesN